MPGFILKALVSDHLLLLTTWSLTREHSRRIPEVEFLNARIPEVVAYEGVIFTWIAPTY